MAMKAELPVRERAGFLILTFDQFKAMGYGRVCRILGIGDGTEIDAERDRDD